eukprot:366399-Chlamydomonas_euryale.AAC.7
MPNFEAMCVLPSAWHRSTCSMRTLGASLAPHSQHTTSRPPPPSLPLSSPSPLPPCSVSATRPSISLPPPPLFHNPSSLPPPAPAPGHT